QKKMKVSGYELSEGDWITLDGGTGELFLGEVPMKEPELGGAFEVLMEWADEVRDMKVRANADTPKDSATARKFGAEGIGLCRTEHMFFGPERIDEVRRMILAEDTASREKALAKLLPMQRQDFYEIFKVMDGLPVTIRLLDPPLHEFLPHEEGAMRAVAADLGVSVDDVRAKVASLQEFNPMLGHRGCRLAITYPAIYEVQTQAIFEAAARLKAEGGNPIPEVMIPLVGTVQELKILKERIRRVADGVLAAKGVSVPYTIGTMIEVPRAALLADKIAQEADFFSFGTNDLTQMTFGFSRDDMGTFLPDYLEQGILEKDPFITLDQAGVGQLVELGTQRGRQGNPHLKIGICGEHGGDPDSV